jgi:hypothetical protein
MVDRMYVDSLNIRCTVPNWPQLTPSIALSVVPTMLSYNTLGESTEIRNISKYGEEYETQTNNHLFFIWPKTSKLVT